MRLEKINEPNSNAAAFRCKSAITAMIKQSGILANQKLNLKQGQQTFSPLLLKYSNSVNSLLNHWATNTCALGFSSSQKEKMIALHLSSVLLICQVSLITSIVFNMQNSQWRVFTCRQCMLGRLLLNLFCFFKNSIQLVKSRTIRAQKFWGNENNTSWFH